MGLHLLIIDDDHSSIEVAKTLLERAGCTVTTLTSSEHALEKIIEIQPDAVLCDLMMPNLDGLGLFRQLKEKPDIKKPAFIIITSKPFESDKERALGVGVDGYFTKPLNPKTFVNDVLETLMDFMTVQFWGVRGTLPVSGEKTVHYGGSTNCVTVKLGKKHFFIFDAGTGIKELSNYLLKRNEFPLKAKIFISHPHYDHINGFPFFAPLFIHGNEFEVFGTNQGEKTIENLISGLMDRVYLPYTISAFSAKLNFRDLNEETFNIDDVQVKTMLLNHPGRCLGYRLHYKNRVFCYVTDNELCLNNSPHYSAFEEERLIDFIKEADVLVIDATYTDEEYAKKNGWGHSCISKVVEVADKAKVKLLCLFHHDPDQFDKDIDAKLRQAIALLHARGSITCCIAPREGEKLLI